MFWNALPARPSSAGTSKQIAVSASGTETAIYVGGILEKVTRSGVTEYRHLIMGGKGVAAIYTRRSDATTDAFYVHSDHLGSPELITNAAGAQVVKLSFGAYGERRDSDWDGAVSSGDMTTIGNTIRHGFTGHEHLDSVNLIHMNGRVYDPVVGRFLSADPFIDWGLGTQGVNRYGYVGNNPLTFTDPSGYRTFGDPEYIKTLCTTGECPTPLPEIVLTALRDRSDMTVISDPFALQYLLDQLRPLVALVIPVAEGNAGDQGENTAAEPPNDPCASALQTARQNQAAVNRALNNWETISFAAAANEIDPALLAAVGVRESGFQNIWQTRGGNGAGVFQIDLGAHPNVTPAQAFDIPFAANYAASLLASNRTYLDARYPWFSAAQLLQATAASYNIGRGGISGNPDTIDVGTSPRGHGNYGSNVVALASCFAGD